MLRVLSEVQHALEEHDSAPDGVKAIIGPTEADDGAVVRVSLHAKTGDTIGAIDKLVSRIDSVENAVTDLADALTGIGIGDLSVTKHFDTEGMPAAVRPYSRR